jgi:hypothetical protein
MASSTTVLGHIGTGVGYHESTWTHYRAPSGPAGTRVVHTQYDYDDANTKIGQAAAASGNIMVDATVWSRVTRWKCGNGACPATGTGSIPSRQGCTVSRSGEHSWTQRTEWVEGAATSKRLYYNKSGARTLVSYHAF